MMIDLVKYPVLTEKSVRLIENNQYTFDVDLRLSKPQIKQLFEELFKVNVIGVNTHRPPRKKTALDLHKVLEHVIKKLLLPLNQVNLFQFFQKIN